MGRSIAVFFWEELFQFLMIMRRSDLPHLTRVYLGHTESKESPCASSIYLPNSFYYQPPEGFIRFGDSKYNSRELNKKMDRHKYYNQIGRTMMKVVVGRKSRNTACKMMNVSLEN